LYNLCIDGLTQSLKSVDFDVIAGIESRGFLFGFAIAQKLNKPFIIIRKAGALFL
jgi:adenine phosphoribosyltransferase